MDDETSVVLSTALVVFGSLAVLYMAMQSRRQIREMEHRERLAMIDRGLVPAPEVDPAAFEASFAAASSPESRATTRWRSAGVMMMGMGLALMFFFASTTSVPEVGVGIGGAFALVGAAFFINSALLKKTELRHRVRPSSSLGVRRADAPESPSNPPAGPPQI